MHALGYLFACEENVNKRCPNNKKLRAKKFNFFLNNVI
jgi:hypothetical protein